MAETPRVVGTKRLREEWPPISEDEVELPGGDRRKWIRLHFGMSTAVLPMTRSGEVLVTREYRHGVGRVTYSLPGGLARDGETPEACARRELLEETGYEPQKLLPLYEGNNLTAYLEGTLHVFFAPGCTSVGAPLRPGEVDGVEAMTALAALDRARRGDFESAVLTLAILLADARGWLTS
jgi:ADP-ribose pyrophosphatase